MGKGQRKANKMQQQKADKLRRRKRALQCLCKVLLVINVLFVLVSIFWAWKNSQFVVHGKSPDIAVDIEMNIFSAWGVTGVVGWCSHKFRMNNEKPYSVYLLGTLVLIAGAILATLSLLPQNFWTAFISRVAGIPINAGLGILFIGIEHLKIDFQKDLDDERLKKFFI